MKNMSNRIASLALLALAGCVVPPATTIKTPLTARPADRDAQAPHNGAIFQAGKFEHPLFEDRHPRNVGDILTINIVETISATQSASNSATNAGSMNASTPTITGPGGNKLSPFNISSTSAGSLSNKSAYAGANTFTGTITVTVVEVLPNGNLLVGGEKQMAINQSNGYIRLSGVVDPTTVTLSPSTGSYTVQSTQVADAHIDYKDADNLDTSQIMTMLGRAFRSFLPF
jgi:flagellar L-ring protein precursor FlgH